MFLLRLFMLLALVVWIGAIIFFAFVVAPTAFHLLLPELAGKVVSRSLTILHWMGIISAMVFLICSLLYNRAKHARLKMLAPIHVFVLIMLVLTLISQFGVIPRMHALRTEMWNPDAPQAQLRAEFDKLHVWSTRLEGGVLLLGVAVIGLTARRFS